MKTKQSQATRHISQGKRIYRCSRAVGKRRRDGPIILPVIGHGGPDRAVELLDERSFPVDVRAIAMGIASTDDQVWKDGVLDLQKTLGHDLGGKVGIDSVGTDCCSVALGAPIAETRSDQHVAFVILEVLIEIEKEEGTFPEPCSIVVTDTAGP